MKLKAHSGSGGQQYRRIFGDDDGVFVMRGEAAVGGADGPAVSGENRLAGAAGDDGLDRDNEAFGQEVRGDGSGQLGTLGFSWMVRPMPWPHRSRMT